MTDPQEPGSTRQNHTSSSGVSSGLDLAVDEIQAALWGEARQRLMAKLLLGQREMTDPKAMMLAAAEAVGEFLHADRAGFFDVSGEDTLDFNVSWSGARLAALSGPFPAVGIGARYLADFRAGKAVGIGDTADSPLAAGSAFAGTGARSILGAPIVRSGRWCAALYVNHADARVWSEDEVDFVREVAEQTWDAVERARAQMALRESETRTCRILQSIGDGVIVTDANALITHMNPVAERLTGWTAQEATGRPLVEVFHILNESTRETLEIPATRVLRSGKAEGLSAHAILISRVGTEAPIEDSAVPMLDDRGKLTGIVLVFRDISERRLAERQRDAMTGLQQEVLDSANDGIAKIDRDWRITFLNRAAREMLAPSGDVLGKNHWESFPASVYEGSPWMEHYYLAMDDRVASEFEEFYREPLNIWIHISVRPIAEGIVVFFRDVTEHHRAAEALRASEERLRMALAAADGVGIWDWDVRKEVVYADAGFAHLFGMDPARATAGIPIGEFAEKLHPEDRTRVGEAVAEALSSGQEYRAEYRLMQPDGSFRWVSAVGRCDFGVDGAPARFPGVTIDITERRKIEEALRTNEERLRIAVETARLGNWHLEIASGRLECSAICKANFGRAPGAGFDYADLLASIHPEDRAAVQAAVREAIENSSIYRAEYRVLWPDGTQHWIVASGQVIQDEDGKASHMVGVTLDVTERYQAAEALMQSEKLAVAGRLAASIAHEINNPLESITNLLYLARNSQKMGEIQEYLEIAERELRRVSVISTQTLRFYRQSTNPREVTAADLFESGLTVCQGRIVNSRIEVEMRLRAGRPALCFDGEIRQVLNNLMGNAIDAMQPDGGRLLLRSREGMHWSSGEKGLILTVADTGEGIGSSALRKIFHPFFTTKGIAGTGLGLWVSREIVTRHGGALRVRSRRGERSGTVFTLFLPFAGAFPRPSPVYGQGTE